MTSVPSAPRPLSRRRRVQLRRGIPRACLTFLRAGLEGGEAVVAVVSQRAEKIVGAALGDDADRIRWACRA